MAHFYEICHENCALNYVGGVLELRKFYYKGLEGQFDVEKANFRGLITKFGHYRVTLATRIQL